MSQDLFRQTEQDILTIVGAHRPLTTYIAGNPGMGKSSLLQRMILADIRRNHGVAVIDPNRDLVERLLHWIPIERVNDVVYFDLEHPVPLNLFSYRKGEREVLTEHLIGLFDLENAPVSRPRLQRLFGTFFDANERGGNFSMLDAIPFIKNKDYRDQVFSFAPHRRADWDPFPAMKEWETVLERLSPFKESETLRLIFGSTSGIDVHDVMENNRILLVSLRDNPIGHFVGALFSAKFQQATFARDSIPEHLRVPYYLYIDECHTILKHAVSEFSAILTRARKYKLCLTLTNQIPSDLPKEIQRKIGTIQNLILFQLSYQDALIFKNAIFPHPVESLLELDFYRAVTRTDRKVHRIITRKRLGPSPASPAHIIIRRNIAASENAADSQKRSGDNAPRQSVLNVVSLNEDGNSRTNLKDEDIRASDTPNVPPYRDQAKGPRKRR